MDCGYSSCVLLPCPCTSAFINCRRADMNFTLFPLGL